MKKVLSIIFTVSLLLTTSVLAYENVVVDGNPVGESVMIDNKIYVPLRSVSETLGAEVSWDGTTAYVTSKNTDELVPEIVAEASEYVVGIIGKYEKDGVEGVAHGSGFVIAENGLIVTNAHVVAPLKRILVVMSDGGTYEARIKNIDNQADIALIQINKTGLKTAKLADINTVEVGQTVIAIGTPISFTLRNSATIGIISGLNRTTNNPYRLIQSDATLNGGNSGGPLVNLKGEVVGMGTQGFQGVSGLYFSVTCDTIQYALNHFEKFGRIRQPILGATLSEGWLAKYDLPSDEGLIIKSVVENSPAAVSGLVAGDSILAVNSVPVSTITDYNEALKPFVPGDTVQYKIKKGNSVITVNIKLV